MPTIDYRESGEWCDVVRALAIVESNEYESKIGDGGQAFGLLQQHPAFFQQYYGQAHIFPADVADSWTVAQIKAAAAYLQIWHTVGRDLLIQGYNRGINGVLQQKNPERNPDYLARFQVAMAKIHGAWPKGV